MNIKRLLGRISQEGYGVLSLADVERRFALQTVEVWPKFTAYSFGVELSKCGFGYRYRGEDVALLEDVLDRLYRDGLLYVAECYRDGVRVYAWNRRRADGRRSA